MLAGVKEKIFHDTCQKFDKEDFIPDWELSCKMLGWYSEGGRDWAQIPILVGIYSQGAGCWSAGGKSLKGNIPGQGDSGQTNRTGFLLEDRPA